MDANTHSSGASNGRTLEDVVNHLHANHETKNECSTDPMDSKEETNDAINDGIDGNTSTHTNGANASQSTSDLNGDQNVTTNEDNNHNENNANNTEVNAESNGSTNDSNDSNDKFLAFDDDDEEDNLLSYDPTPDTSYPSVKWHSLQQLQQREYGKLMRPGNSRPINSYESQAFRRYAYNSLYFFQRLELMSKFEEHTGCVNCLNFNNCGDRLISGSDDLRVAVWDWQKSHLIHKYHTGHSSNVFQCRWCADQHHIVSCARDGQVRICNVNRNGSTVSNKLAQHKGAVHKLTLTAPQVILSCGEDSVVFEIDLRDNKPTKLLNVKNASQQRVPLYSVHANMVFNPLQFAVSGRDPFVRIYDRRFLPISEPNGTANPVLSICPEKLKQTKHSVTCCQFNSTADKLLATYNDEDIYTFDPKTGLSETRYSGHRNNATVKGCAWFGDQYIVSGSDDGYVYGWDSQTQHIVMSLYADENGVVNCIEPHPTAPIMATSGLDDDVKVWVPSANEWPQTMKGIKQRICANIKERQRSHRRLERLGDGFDRVDGAMDAAMLYEIIRHMRRRSRRRRNAANNDNEEDDSEDTDSDSDADNGPQECIQS